MKSAVIVSRHGYGPGGGANAVLWFARALHDLEFQVTLCALSATHPQVSAQLGQIGAGQRPYYQGCSHDRDLLLNIDHFLYEPPLARLNAAHIFHPHGPTQAAGGRDNLPPDGYQRLSANSFYTEYWCRREWGKEVPHLYIPIGRGFYVGQKANRILHVSRFAAPQELADKGQAQLIRAFQWMCDSDERIKDRWELCLAGSLEDQRYLTHLETLAVGYPITFFPSIAESELYSLYASAAFYWHATGASLPQVHGAQEHLGLTTLEAMASGCVPVVLGTGGQPEIVDSEWSGVCCQDTPTIGRATLELIADMPAWAQMARHATENAAPWQDYDAFVGRVEDWLTGCPIRALPQIERFAPALTPADVCAIVPARDRAEMTAKLVESVLRTQPDLGQIVVVDNGSEEAEIFCATVLPALRPGIDSIAHADPLTFAAAMNLGATCGEKPLLLALNNDMLAYRPNWLGAMLGALEDDVAVVGAKLIFPDGNLQHAGGAVDWNRLDIGYHRHYGAEDVPAASQRLAVPFVTGACLLARRSTWHWDELAGGIGMEDVDLCLSAWADGWRVVYEPAACLVHYEGLTRNAIPGARVSEELSERNRRAFIDKWYMRQREVYPWWATVFGMGGKA